MRSMEFQAVILAGGRGSRMTDLTASTPKALLPVANKPMIWYPVKMLENAGFEEVIIIVQKAHQSDIQKALAEICGVKIGLDFHAIPPNEDWGTADALRHIKDKVRTDLLVLSCDLITDLPLHRLADLHRTHDAALTMLLAPLPDFTEITAPGGKANRKMEKDLVGLDEKGNRVLFFSAEADFEETVSFRKSLFKKHPFMTVHTRLLDGHLYLMKRWVLDLLAADENMAAVKGELIPYLVKHQFTSRRPEAQLPEKSSASIASDDNLPDLHELAEMDSLTKLAADLSSYDANNTNSSTSAPSNLRCYAYVHRDGFCMRVNSIIPYCEANRQLPQKLSIFTGFDEPAVHPTVEKQPKATVGADSMVGQSSQIGEKTAIKRSVIGQHCTINGKVRITNCLLMDHVVVGEGCTLTGCIVGENVQLAEKCELKDCLVGSSQHIPAMSKSTNEVLVDVSQMMEI